jgi:S-adenosylmethionine:tRNA ribosyltransferase-isomerase
VEIPDYELPATAIAQRPAEPRDSARLLDATDPACVRHRQVRDLPEILRPGDVVVVNTSRVIPARLRLRKVPGGQAEVLLLEPEDPLAVEGPVVEEEHPRPYPGSIGSRAWKALVKPGRRLPPGTVLTTSGGVDAVRVGDRLADGQRRVELLQDPEQVLAAAGSVALPPYIRTPLDDPERYQTVYADVPGSVAAPTAGLHLTDDLLAKVRAGRVDVRPVDLAVGLATFRPLKVERAEDHFMHVERYRVPEATWEACRQARRVIAVGTTTVRALETAAVTGELTGESKLYISGVFPFSVVDVLMTNFHLPRSTLLLLLEAFCGRRWRALYAEALSAGYHFLSFGDAMVVGRQTGAARAETA